MAIAAIRVQVPERFSFFSFPGNRKRACWRMAQEVFFDQSIERDPLTAVGELQRAEAKGDVRHLFVAVDAAVCTWNVVVSPLGVEVAVLSLFGVGLSVVPFEGSHEPFVVGNLL